MPSVHWSRSFKKSIFNKLARGVDPEELKKSFSDLLENLASPDALLKQARAEIRRLKKQLAEKKG